LGAFTSLGLASCWCAAFVARGNRLPEAGMAFLVRLDLQSLRMRQRATLSPTTGKHSRPRIWQVNIPAPEELAGQPRPDPTTSDGRKQRSSHWTELASQPRPSRPVTGLDLATKLPAVAGTGSHTRHQLISIWHNDQTSKECPCMQLRLCRQSLNLSPRLRACRPHRSAHRLPFKKPPRSSRANNVCAFV
jgi:hypothetical protein